MERPIALRPSDVPSHLRTVAGYSGRKFSLQACDEYTIPSCAGLWDGGSREAFYYVRLSDGATQRADGANLAPWSMERTDRTVRLAPGYALAEHTIFCGKDLGLRFYVHPESVAKLLPAAKESAPLTEAESVVLDLVCGLKAFARRERARERGITAAQYDSALEALNARGFVNKAGAVTVDGRNARTRTGAF